MILNSFFYSLRGKIILVVLATTLAALSVMAAALVAYDLVTYERSRVADLASLGSILARASTSSLVFDDPKTANENLTLLNVRPTISAAAIYDARGERFANYEQAAAGQPPAAPFPARLAQIPREDGYAIASGQVTIYQRIIEKQDLIGVIYVRGSYKPLVRLNDYLGIMSIVMPASLLAAVLISIWLQRRITGPILTVTGIARQVMEKRDYSLRAPRTTADEIGVLVDAFNGMLDEVERRAEALRETDRRKDEFLATLAHELRNPLAPMRNALELLRRAGQDKAVATTARDMMERQLRQMIRLVDDLLDVSRITTGKLAIQKDRTDLQTIIRNALETARPLIDGRRQVLSVDTPPGPIPIEADAVRLAQVFSNLLNNAAKFTPDQGRITLAVERRDNEVAVSVSDTGIGLSAEMLPVIFGMFTQGDSSLERAQSGLGVGLSLARRLVELHGGTLEASSEGLGHGSRFTVRLPLSAPAAPAATPTDRAAEPAAEPRYRILVVDDNVDFATSLRALLESMDHKVCIAHDGERALVVAAEFKPDFALLDIGMPRLNGYDLAQRLHGEPGLERTVFVAVTGWGQEKDRQRSRAAHFDHHLVKPVELGQLKDIFAARRNRPAA